MTIERRWPSYQELLAADPPGSSWSTFGESDQLGTINFLTPAVRKRALGLVQHGRTFNLDYPLNAFDPSPIATRGASRHTLFQSNPLHFDDWLDSFYLQSTSQIDGLRHMGYPGHGFYGGTPAEAISAETPTLGIQHWAESGIVGRGVLLDVERHFRSRGEPLHPATVAYLGPSDLEDVASAQGVEFQDGDILLLRTGWAGHFLLLDAPARAELGRDIQYPGLIQSSEMVAWLWDHHVALVAADNVGVEATPHLPASDLVVDTEVPPEEGNPQNGGLHRSLIALLGMALGELWALDELAEDCAQDGVYEMLVVAKPTNLIGGVGSTANALAMK